MSMTRVISIEKLMISKYYCETIVVNETKQNINLEPCKKRCKTLKGKLINNMRKTTVRSELMFNEI